MSEVVMDSLKKINEDKLEAEQEFLQGNISLKQLAEILDSLDERKEKVFEGNPMCWS